MAKKSFKKNAQQTMGGLGSIIQNTTRAQTEAVEKVIKEEKPVVPKKENNKVLQTPKVKTVEKRPTSERGCLEGETRKTFILRKDLAEKMMDIAYWEPGKLKDHVNEALEAYVKAKWSRKRPE